jgi:hypothetical protein
MNIMHQTAKRKTPNPMIRPRENTTAITNPPRKTLSRNMKSFQDGPPGCGDINLGSIR